MGKKLSTYLINGKDYGPKVIEIGNWSGKAIHSPNSYLTTLINERAEFNKPGVYILKSKPQDSVFAERVYIGEGEIVGERIKGHLKDPNKDFDECIIFISKDEMLNKGHITYLEARLIDSVRACKNAELENNTTPKSEHKVLHEADLSDMEIFLDEIKIILPSVGYNCCKENTIILEDNIKPGENEKLYFLKRGKIEAQLLVKDNRYIVLKGSTCKKNHNNSMKMGRVNEKEKLIKTNILIDKGSVYEFVEDTFFSSTSSASSIILGAQTSGPKAWKDSSGRTYSECTNDNLK